MRGSRSQRELLWVINREEVEIHIGNDVSGRRRFRRCVGRSVAAGKHWQREQADEKKTELQISIVHKDFLLASANVS